MLSHGAPDEVESASDAAQSLYWLHAPLQVIGKSAHGS
jgi:hypothetical protein